jgi:hypothetical protein
MIVVTGYHDDRLYSLAVDEESPAGLNGLVAAASPQTPIDVLRAHAGTIGHLSQTGEDITITLDTVEGILAGLTTHTQVARIDGYDLPGADTDPSVAVH